jgi:hypothetical protein
MKNFTKTLCLLAFTLSVFSCKKTASNQSLVDSNSFTSKQMYVTEFGDEISTHTMSREIDNPPNCPIIETTLIAGQTLDAGTVRVYNDSSYIYVTYNTQNGWVLSQTHLYVGDCAFIPVNNPGNPLPGQFPYATSHSNITSYTYQVPLSQIVPGNCGCIAAHAVVKKLNTSNQVIDSQTGWGNGVRINLTGGNWGMKFNYCSCSN